MRSPKETSRNLLVEVDMKLIKLAALGLLLLGTASSHGQERKTGTVYSYEKDGVRYYSAKPPPAGSSEGRSIGYSFIALSGTWVEKAGNAVYVFDDGYNFEYHNAQTTEKGVWAMATDNCTVGSSKGNLYIQAGTDRCCYNASFYGENLVLTALATPRYVGVCSDRVLHLRQPSP